MQKGLYTGSYAAFYPGVWNLTPYPEGTPTWSHMWFVVYLFIFCMLLLPVFGIFKIHAVAAFKEKLSTAFSNPFIAVLLSLPLIYYYFTLFIKYPEQQSLLDDWFLFLFSITLLFYGYLLGGNIRFWQSCEKYRYFFLAMEFICVVVLFYGYWWNFNMPKKQNASLYAYGIINSLHTWTLILAILGFAKRYLNFSNRFLRYTNQAVYPYYILHQTVIVAVGYYVVQWPLPVFVKLIILIVTCFCTVGILYHFLIKRFILTRILYGLKPKDRRDKVR